MRRVAWMTALGLLMAVGLRAAEPDTPVVHPDNQPEVADPDLQDAAPAVREGAGEPVGGFKDAGLKGLSGFSLGWDQAAVLGWTRWYSDGLAFKASVGGSYNDSQGGPVVSDLSERVALRFAAVRLGKDAYAFWQVSAGARQKHSYTETQTALTSTAAVQFDSTDVYTHAYGAGLDLGAEVFWPGSRHVSLEASAGLGALWTFTETTKRQAFQPGTAGVATGSSTSGRGFELGTRFNGLNAAVNVYF